MNNQYYTDFQGQNTNKTAEKDAYGNVQGNQYDLAKDNAFEDKIIAVLHLYTGRGGENFDFSLPETALKEKGFKVIRWQNNTPPLEEFKSVLAKSTQFWLISEFNKSLNNDYLNVISEFFNSGRGLFLWGDNDPLNTTVNVVLEKLFKTKMSGNTMGDQVVSLQREKSQIGIIPNHAITTGIEFLYEGITIATIEGTKDLIPLMYGSAGNLVSAYYEKDGKRAIIDGGFTRLYFKWDTAGTARFVKNAAAWLANVERFNPLIKKPDILEKKPISTISAPIIKIGKGLISNDNNKSVIIPPTIKIGKGLKTN